MMVDITETMEINTFADLYCSVCNSLLSRPPILINVYGKNICGRCESEVPVGLHLHNVYFETLARQFQFPCRFNNEGCKVNKPCKRMKAHEEICPYQKKKCGIKTCQWSGIPTELIIHYKKYHKELIIESLEKQLLVKDSGSCILAIEGFYFFIEWSSSELNFKLSINNLHLLHLDCDILFNYNLFPQNLEVKRITGPIKLNNSIILNLQDICKASTSVLLSLYSSLSVDNINKKTDALNKIVCPNCSCRMIPPILMCPAGHFTCVDCSDTDYDYCKICDDDEISFKRMDNLEIIAASSLYKCKWKDCDEDLSIRDIEDHQRVCSKRMYICLHCPIWKGVLDEIGDHVIVCTSKDYICPMFTETEITVQGTITEGDEYSLIAHKEQFYVLFQPFSDGGIEVAVCNCGPPSLFGWYCYEVVLHHTEDLCFPFNKTYILKSKSSNRYSVIIPVSDFVKFGGNIFTKITVKVHLLSGSERLKNVTRHFKWFK